MITPKSKELRLRPNTCTDTCALPKATAGKSFHFSQLSSEVQPQSSHELSTLSTEDGGDAASIASVLASARLIEDLRNVHYPAGVASPRGDLNINSKGSRFRYDRDFLLQFMNVCKGTPAFLIPPDSLSIHPGARHVLGSNQSHLPSRTAVAPTPKVASPGDGNPNRSVGGRRRSQRGNKEKRIVAASDIDPAGTIVAPQVKLAQAPLDTVSREVRALLAELTHEGFDSISARIIACANDAQGNDGRTLAHIVRLVYEKATSDTVRSDLYARLCRKMTEQVSPTVRDAGIKKADGTPVGGGQLYRKYLLEQCREDFERIWVAKGSTMTRTSDDYRRGQNLVRFVGELFMGRMITERILHIYVKTLLGGVSMEDTEEQRLESLCELLSIAGRILDSPKARKHMDVYFTRLKELSKSSSLSVRVRSAIQDVIVLRERKWLVAVSRSVTAVDD